MMCKHRILVGRRREKAGRLFAAGILLVGKRCVKCGRRLERFGSWVRWGEPTYITANSERIA